MVAKIVTAGHTNSRRVIWDLIRNGDAGGGNLLSQLSYFAPVYAGAQIGGACEGFGHYHETMWETYIVLEGKCIMSLREMKSDITTHEYICVEAGQPPIIVEVPPFTVHRLIAVTSTTLLIAASGTQSPDDTIEAELTAPC